MPRTSVPMIMSDFPKPSSWVEESLRSGLVIPAHPLALTRNRRLDERRQRALSRYYHAAGAGGLAIGVHTTQFAIRDPQHALLRPVLTLAAETVTRCDEATGRRTVLVAGLCGSTKQARDEAVLARELGYDVGLISLAALADADDDALIAHCRAVAREIPLFGFYLQPAVGGRVLTPGFWRSFAEIPNVIAIKIAPFNRYQTLDVIRAVAESGRAREIALYTGNDDTIVVDLLTQFEVPVSDRVATLGFAGGLLGHWACQTHSATRVFAACRDAVESGTVPTSLLTLAAQVTDANSAYFDAAHGFAGCIAGIHEVLRRQGLLENACCLDPHENLSPGQSGEIDRVLASYPHLTDDAFIEEHRSAWLS